MEMRSYGAARTCFSILGFLSWSVLVLGGLIAIVGIGTMGQVSRGYGGPSLAGLAGILPGMIVMFFGFVGLVVVQLGRATVDTAEYTQQGLKIAREQLEVSRQSLKQSGALQEGYAALQATKAELQSDRGLSHSVPGASYADVKPNGQVASDAVDAEDIDYGGRTIRPTSAGYAVGEKVFASLEKAKSYVDDSALPEPPKSVVPKPYADQLGVADGSKSNVAKPT